MTILSPLMLALLREPSIRAALDALQPMEPPASITVVVGDRTITLRKG